MAQRPKVLGVPKVISDEIDRLFTRPQLSPLNRAIRTELPERPAVCECGHPMTVHEDHTGRCLGCHCQLYRVHA